LRIDRRIEQNKKKEIKARQSWKIQMARGILKKCKNINKTSLAKAFGIARNSLYYQQRKLV
jgi:hypothetical protein